MNNISVLLIVNFVTLIFQLYLFLKISEIKSLFSKLSNSLIELDTKVNRLIKNIEEHGFKITVQLLPSSTFLPTIDNYVFHVGDYTKVSPPNNAPFTHLICLECAKQYWRGFDQANITSEILLKSPIEIVERLA